MAPTGNRDIDRIHARLTVLEEQTETQREKIEALERQNEELKLLVDEANSPSFAEIMNTPLG